jgi:hypothetical protein
MRTRPRPPEAAQAAARAEAGAPADAEYQVGYARPPKQHQFAKGQTGNPKGRPKAARNTADAASRYLDASVMVRERGRARRMNRRQILIHQLYDRATKGDNRAAAILLDLDLKARAHERAPAAAGAAAEAPIADAADLAILARYAEALSKARAS